MSGLSQKVRRGDIREEERTASARQIHALTNRHSRTPVSEAHFLTAQRLLATHETGLRAGDALHLAIAADFDLVTVTLDKTMAAAASGFDMTALLL